MMTVNMHEAKTHLLKLVKAIGENNETVIHQRNGIPVAELRRFRREGKPVIDRLKTHAGLRVTFAPGYRPAESLWMLQGYYSPG